MKRTAGRDDADSKLRRDGRHCPVCLRALPRISGKARPARKCTACGAEPEPEKRCARCHEGPVWISSSRAGCPACGNHGSALRVILGALEQQ
jgi:hypothetical protein